LEENEGEEDPIFKPAILSGFQIAARTWLATANDGHALIVKQIKLE